MDTTTENAKGLNKYLDSCCSLPSRKWTQELQEKVRMTDKLLFTRALEIAWGQA